MSTVSATMVSKTTAGALAAALPLLVAVPGRAAPVVAAAEVMTEARGGEAPLVPGEESTAGVAAVVRPGVELRLRAPLHELRARYAPRLHWRHPNPADRSRPLVLHEGQLAARARPARTVAVIASAAVSAGDADYASLPQLVGEAQGTLPAELRLLVAGGALGVEAAPARGWRLDAAAMVTHRRPLDTPPPGIGVTAGGPGLARQTLAAVTPGLARQLSARDRVGVRAGLLWAQHASGLEAVVWRPTLEWQRQPGPEHNLSLAAGAAYTRQRGGRTAPGDEHQLTPVGRAAYEGPLAHWAAAPAGPEGRLRGALALEVEQHLDLVLGTSGARGVAGGWLALEPGPGWLIRLEGMMGTSLRRAPLPGDPNETFVMAALPLRRRLSTRLLADAGVRWSDRGPHLDHGLDLRQRELWLYLGLTAHSWPEPR
jgi:hypothetical protein